MLQLLKTDVISLEHTIRKYFLSIQDQISSYYSVIEICSCDNSGKSVKNEYALCFSIISLEEQEDVCHLTTV